MHIGRIKGSDSMILKQVNESRGKLHGFIRKNIILVFFQGVWPLDLLYENAETSFEDIILIHITSILSPEFTFISSDIIYPIWIGDIY